MEDSLNALRRKTKQGLGLARASVLADARAIVESRGAEALIVTHLAKKHSVAPLTARRWLDAAGFSLGHLSRGRPTLARLAEIAESESGE